MKAIKRTIMTMGFISLFTIGLTQQSWSYAKGDDPVEFKVIGNINNSPLFQFNANNQEDGEYILKVRDENGLVLYSDIMKGKNISRKYRLDVTDFDANLNVRFEVTSLKTKEKFVYNVSRNSRVVEEVIIAKL